MWVTAINKGKINVIDFGGSLGSSYFQNKKFLDTLEVKWNIIEQDSFVRYGQEIIQDNRVNFFYSLEDAISINGFPDLLIIACTLPYLKQPYDSLIELMKSNISYLIIDNTPFNYEPRDRITVQKVPPAIYKASYPCWFLDYNKVVKTVTERYTIISEHENDSYIFLDGRKINYRGFLAKNKSAEK
jgi:putative methyltransferase (TIGR04325 family)